jgi:glycosyltransferase involved in cell wall biosynthesis
LINKIVLVADAYPPSQSSAALQLRDLAAEFFNQGILPTVVVPDPGLTMPYAVENIDGIEVLRLKTFKYKSVGLYRRTFSEILMPFLMAFNFRRSPLKDHKWDAVVWYSPTIFLGFYVYYITKKNHCKSYLILRDIFPAWALDLGLLKKGLPYYFFCAVEYFQYKLADSIGVQSFGNLNYFKKWPSLSSKNIEVLQNWLAPKPLTRCSVRVESLPIGNRKIFVYAGNMGIAQGMEIILDLAESLITRCDIGFLLIGQGSNKEALMLSAVQRGLSNVVFADEISPDEIPGLYAQCHIGLIVLDPRHKTHNVPGKLLSYLSSGLPVLAIVNQGNDLEKLIEKNGVGRVTTSCKSSDLKSFAEAILKQIEEDGDQISIRCKNLAQELFSPRAAVSQIMQSLNNLT